MNETSHICEIGKYSIVWNIPKIKLISYPNGWNFKKSENISRKKGKKREWEYQHMSECRKESHYLYNKGKKIKTEPSNRLYTQMDLGLTANQCSN